MNNKELVLKAASELFGAKDPSAVGRWVAPDYRQHSSLAADGPEALRALVAGLPADFHYEPARVIADGNLVALHGTYHGFGPEPAGGLRPLPRRERQAGRTLGRADAAGGADGQRSFPDRRTGGSLAL